MIKSSTTSSGYTSIAGYRASPVTIPLLNFVTIHWIHWNQWKSFRENSIIWCIQDRKHSQKWFTWWNSWHKPRAFSFHQGIHKIAWKHTLFTGNTKEYPDRWNFFECVELKTPKFSTLSFFLYSMWTLNWMHLKGSRIIAEMIT